MAHVSRRQRLLLILMVLTAAFIWGNSLLPASVSGAISARFAGLLSRALGLELTTSAGHGVLRKLAHGTEFLALGLEAAALLRLEWEKPWSLVALLGLGTCFLDETIQLFVAGRDGKLPDMWIDLGGFLAGVLICLLIRRLIRKRKPSGT